jgi:hypothetical protein
MTYLPRRDCLFLMEGNFWVHVRFSVDPLPTWSEARTGETVNLAEVVAWEELPVEHWRMGKT